jgi:hypothetical protein
VTDREADNRRDEAAFEALLERALRIDVPDAATARRPGRGGRSRWPLLAAAAGVLVVVGMLVGRLDDSAYFPSGDLAGDVIVHVHHEPMAIQDTDAVRPVPSVEFKEVLQAAGVRMAPVKPMVRYAKLCPFRGEMVAHFVVQGPEGPVTVLLLPDEDVPAAIPVEEDGFVGTIVPMEQGGSIAVVGESGAAVEEIQREVAAAVQWRL